MSAAAPLVVTSAVVKVTFSLCLFVSRITWRLLDRFLNTKFMCHGRNYWILVVIWICMWMQEFLRNFFIQIDLLHINVSVKHINGERSGNSWHSCASVLYEKCIWSLPWRRFALSWVLLFQYWLWDYLDLSVFLFILSSWKYFCLIHFLSIFTCAT